MKTLSKKYHAFTLLEILLVVSAIAILAGIVIVAINPSEQLAKARDAKRASDVETILNAVYQYAIDNDGALPADIPSGTADNICTTGGTCATGDADLSELTTAEEYIVSIPTDPQDGTADVSGYFIVRTANNRVTVSAPGTEIGPVITVTR